MFSKQEILEALNDIAETALKQNKTVEIGIYGGSAIVLSWEFRKSTRDVDVAIYNDADYLKDIARQIAQERNLPEDWLNDGVKGFLSNKEERQLFLELPENSETKGLRVFTPTPEYLLAMKCMAMRIGGLENSSNISDIEDIKNLIQITGLNTKDQIISLVEKFYPENLIQPKVLYGIEEIVESLQKPTIIENKEIKPKPDFKLGVKTQTQTPKPDAFAQDVQNRQEQKNKIKFHR